MPGFGVSSIVSQKCHCGAVLSPPADGRRHRCGACGLVYSCGSDYYSGVRVGRRPDQLPPEEPLDAYPVDWSYSTEDLERIRWGLTPASMDDQWYAYLEADELFMFRTRSGALCYKLRLTPTGIDQVRVARSVPRHDWHLTYVRWLVEDHLVGRDWPFPA